MAVVVLATAVVVLATAMAVVVLGMATAVVVLAMAVVLAAALVAVVSAMAMAVALVLQMPFAPQMRQYHSARSSLDQNGRRVDRKSAAAENCCD
jgi:hypothetical protein